MMHLEMVEMLAAREPLELRKASTSSNNINNIIKL